MRLAIVIVISALVLVATVTAGNRKVLVLPVDGTADAKQRSSINDSVLSMAKAGIDGDVTAGDTTFNETAAAVGCTPDEPTCADTVMKTLSVDELVWGTAQTENGSTTVTIHRAAKGEPGRQQMAVIDKAAGGDATASALQPLFEREQAVGSGSETGSGSGSADSGRQPRKSFFDTKERKLGLAFGGGSLVCLVIGLSMWNSESKLQDQIDSHPNMTLPQLQDLHELEERAASKALWGNIFVFLGLAAGGTSAYFFWHDHKNRGTVVAPVPTEDGAGVKMVLGGRW
ncbi:MAG TPA: hypothetical protein VL326_07245 [Kofleriaceae bacterium]|nr:hypothetical protein [Kofleriaceae bacterium]